MEAPNYLYGTGYGSPFLDGRKSYVKMPELKTGVQIGDFFHIDDLLDFSNEEIAGPIGETGNNWPNCMTAADSSTITMAETVSCNSSVDGNGSRSNTAPETDEHNPGDLCVPCDDLAELEWLSNFVEESFSTEEAAKPLLAPNFGDGTTENEAQKAQTADPFDRTASPMSVLDTSSCSRKTPSFSPEMRLPGRARSKRSRAPVCKWSSRIVSPTSSASALENGPTSSAFSSDSDLFAESSLPSKKIVKTNKGTRKKEQEQHIQTRRCMHCDTQKTPQWRTGPMGPKTLCNACGVRFKSGRLVPEYRPAASPSFVVSKHSNSHRKVLEMRRQKELELQFAACHGDDNHEDEYEDEDEDEDEDGDGSQEHHPYFGSDEDGYLLHTTQDYRHLI